MNAPPSTPAAPDAPPRFIVGIDLGTTNCAVAVVDTKGGGRAIADRPVRQCTGPGVREPRDTLPSFLYALTPDETTEDDRRVDPAYRVGIHARDHGALTPGRLITSAKSWLCHAGVDRESAILPWHAADGVPALSPVRAQALILRHLRVDWDDAHPDTPLAGQDVLITVPASFDEVARELTIAAAKQAGLPRVILLEEPQAAFYAWLARHETTWTDELAPDDHILVCDVGGGTTDFTLIHARPGDGGAVAFHRTAVGDHLILGGDNLDLALAHHLEHKLGEKLDARSWTALVRLCRQAKETLLGDRAPETLDVALPGQGAGLLRGQRRVTVSRAEVEAILLDGFLPAVELDATPQRRSSGFQEFGLPFAADPGITRYLAEFLRANLPRNADGTPRPPRAILLNGGLFESTAMRHRLVEVLTGWFRVIAPDWSPKLLDHRRLDLAVARGAAYFGLVRRGLGVKVISHLARSYYIGVADADGPDRRRALCLAPAGLAAGHPVRIDTHPLTARLKTPVEFPLYVSSRRTTDRAGELVDLDAETFTALPPLRTVLTAGKQATQETIAVGLSAALTELGALDLAIVEANGPRTWKLAIDLRAATQTDLAFHEGAGERTGLIEAERIARAADRLTAYFQKSAKEISAVPVLKEMEACLETERADWPVSALREFWTVLRDLHDVRTISAVHEQRWLNLLGYCLRPGFGLALDDWRVQETWKFYHVGPVNRAAEAVRAEWWILWRRIAGGLSAGQQAALASPLLAGLKTLGGKPKARLPAGWDIALNTHEAIEWLRLLGALERLPLTTKEGLGRWLIDRIGQKGWEAEHGAAAWALGRLAAREPLCGPLNLVLPPETVDPWVERLLHQPGGARDIDFLFTSIGRFTGDRYRDLGDSNRQRIAIRLRQNHAPEHWITLVERGGLLNSEEKARSFGDTLPCGLTLSR